MYDKLKKSFEDAIYCNDLLRIALLVRQAPQEFYLSYNPLVGAVLKNRPDIVEFLLEEKIDIASISKAFYWACRYAHADIMKMLIDAGANVNLVMNGDAPLVIFAKVGYTELVKMLLDAGADPNIRQFGNWTALMHAAYSGHKDVVQSLIEAQADVNLQNDQGRTALIYACNRRHTKIVEILLEAGADPSIRDKENKTAIDYAYYEGLEHTVQSLIKHQAAQKARQLLAK